MRDAMVNNLLEIFDLIDVGKNGKLTLLELKPIFEVISITEASQFSLYMMVDTDNSGQIDFSEFIELLYLVGKAYKAQNKKRMQKSKNKPRATPNLLKTNSFVSAVKSKMWRSPFRSIPRIGIKNDKIPEEKVSEEKVDGPEDASTSNKFRAAAKKVLFRRLSVVSAEDEQFVSDVKHEREKVHFSSDDDSSRISHISEIVKPDDEAAVKSFFRHELNKSHSYHDGGLSIHTEDELAKQRTPLVAPDKEVVQQSFFEQEFKKSRSKSSIHLDSDKSAADNSSHVNIPDNCDKAALNLSSHIKTPDDCEKATLNFSFFEKEKAKGVHDVSFFSNDEKLAELSEGESKALLNLADESLGGDVGVCDDSYESSGED